VDSHSKSNAFYVRTSIIDMMILVRQNPKPFFDSYLWNKKTAHREKEKSHASKGEQNDGN